MKAGRNEASNDGLTGQDVLNSAGRVLPARAGTKVLGETIGSDPREAKDPGKDQAGANGHMANAPIIGSAANHNSRCQSSI